MEDHQEADDACPFCGAGGGWLFSQGVFADLYFYIRCLACFASGPKADTVREAWQAMRRRPGSAAPALPELKPEDYP